MKPSSSCRTVLILGIGNGFLTSHLLTSLKLLTTLTILSFFGAMNVGKDHSDHACHFSTPKSHGLWISFLWFPSAFGVLKKAYHDMVLIPPFTGERPAHNPSHLVSH